MIVLAGRVVPELPVAASTRRQAAARARAVRAGAQPPGGRAAAARRPAGARGRRDQRARRAHRGLGRRSLPDRAGRPRRERRAAGRPLRHRGRPLPRRLLPLGIPLAPGAGTTEIPAPQLRARVDVGPALRRGPRPKGVGPRARLAGRGEPVHRPARPAPRCLPLPPPLPRPPPAGARGPRAGTGADAQPAGGGLVRGPGRRRGDARLLACGRQREQRRAHPQLDRDARLGLGAGRFGRVVARPLRRRGAAAPPGSRRRGLADPRPPRAAGGGRGLAGGSRARCAGEECEGRGHEGLYRRRPRGDVRRGTRDAC